MKLKIFCRCSLFPSWSGEGLISTPVFHISGCNCAVAFCFPFHTQVSLRLDYVLYIQRTLEVAVADCTHVSFREAPLHLRANHRQEVTVGSCRNCSNCCTPCSIGVLALLSTDS